MGATVLYVRRLYAVGQDPAFNYVSDAGKLIFSWCILAPIAIIVSGKLLGQVIRFDRQSDSSFQVPIPKILKFGAKDDEVLLGFVLFLVEFFLLAVVAGPGVYHMFTHDFGIDLGQFTSIAAFCAFLSATVALVVMVVWKSAVRYIHHTDDVTERHEAAIQAIARGGRRSAGE